MVKKISTKAVALGTLVAAGAGYLAGVLTAPKSGKETRNDITRTASKARSDSEKQLKKLHSELTDVLNEVENRANKAKTKAGKELTDATDKAKKAKAKAKEVLSALHNGDADDPNLQAVVEEVKLAKTNLVKYLKK
jgi:gas vesicle protein